MEILLKLIMCHAVGDYVLQTDYMATAKGKDWYVLIMHCICYTVPFAVVFGIEWKLAVIFVTHVVTDALKAKYHKINLAKDQIIHYVTALVYLF